MQLNTHKIDDITVVDVLGNLDTSTSSEAEKYFNELLSSTIDKLIINLERTEYISSSGLRVFLGVAKKMMVSNGKVVLTNPNELIDEILQHSGFDAIIKFFPNNEDAISFLNS